MARKPITTDDVDEAVARARESFRGFFVALGYAISRWAHVDRALFGFCKFALQTTEAKTAIVFYRSPSIGDHQKTVDKLMRISVRDARLKQWIKINETIDQLLPFRNDIAHSPARETIEISGLWNPSGREPTPEVLERLAAPPKRWWAIYTEPTKLLRNARSIEAKREDIIEHIKEIDELLSNMWSLQRALPKRPIRKPQLSTGQAALPMSVPRKKDARDRAKPRPRPRSSPG
jgi:hypothetical protein